jgi:hypothetical protein
MPLRVLAWQLSVASRSHSSTEAPTEKGAELAPAIDSRRDRKTTTSCHEHLFYQAAQLSIGSGDSRKRRTVRYLPPWGQPCTVSGAE